MAGGNHPKSSSSLRKTRWESSSTTTTTNNKNNNNNNTIPHDPNPKPPTKPNPSPKPNNNPTPSPAQAHPPGPPPPPPPPAYGFHMLDRRTIILADGSVRSYFALPPDYQDFTPPPPLPPPPRPPMDSTAAARFLPGPDFGGQRFAMSPEGFRDNWNSVGEKRKFGNGEEKDDFIRQMQRHQHQQHFMNYGPPNGFLVGPSGPGPGTSSPFRRDMGEEIRAAKYMRVGGESLIHNKHLEVDQNALKKAFLHFVKLINENPAQRKTYLEHGKQGGRLHCVACSRFCVYTFFDVFYFVIIVIVVDCF